MTTQYALQVVPGTPASKRLQELEAARFVDVRNLANLVYKKADGSPLLTFQETLEKRPKVYDAVIQFELAAGLLVNDLSDQPVPTVPVPQASAVPQNGVNYMTTMPPPGMMPPPAGMPQQLPQAMPVPQMMPPPATAAQAAAVPQGMPQPQAAPEMPTGRKRRGAGSAVAPPPAAVPMATSAPEQQFAPAPGMYQAPSAVAAPAPAPAPMAAPGFAPAPAPAAFVQQAAPAPMAAPVAAPVAPAPAAAVDLSPILQRLDSLGKGVELSANGVESLKSELAATKRLCLELITAVHHIYMTNPGLAQAAADGQNINDFRTKYLPRYMGQGT